MFTGIVLGTAEVVDRQPRSEGERLTLEAGELCAGAVIGESVAINGVCLTAVVVDGGRVEFDLAGETLRRSNLGDLSSRDVVNVERSLRLGDRLDGHMVQGHVDGVGVVSELRSDGDDWWLKVEAEPELLQQMIFKGSIAVDGISLTIAQLDERGFACTIIPHTREITNLVARAAGQRVNLEVDMVGKWVQRIVAGGSADGAPRPWEKGG